MCVCESHCQLFDISDWMMATWAGSCCVWSHSSGSVRLSKQLFPHVILYPRCVLFQLAVFVLHVLFTQLLLKLRWFQGNHAVQLEPNFLSSVIGESYSCWYYLFCVLGWYIFYLNVLSTDTVLATIWVQWIVVGLTHLKFRFVIQCLIAVVLSTCKWMHVGGVVGPAHTTVVSKWWRACVCDHTHCQVFQLSCCRPDLPSPAA